MLFIECSLIVFKKRRLVNLFSKRMTNSIQKKFGEFVRKKRKEQGFSQESFAFKAKLHRTYMGAIERGEKNITIKNIEKIAFCLEIKISEIFSAIEI